MSLSLIEGVTETDLYVKGAEAAYVEKITVMKKWFRLKDMLDFNFL